VHSKRLVVLASGSGTNLQALLDAPDLGGDVVGVVSDRPGARALERAAARGAQTATVPLDGDRVAWEATLTNRVAALRPDLVVLAGFMRILSSRFIDAFPRRIINTHPALLPAFPGLHAVEQALLHGVKVAGCTVHFVDGGVDTGPIIAQACVPVLDSDSDDAASLHERIKAKEHELLPRAVALLAQGRLSVQGRAVRSREARPEGASNHAD
jgi:phosphoribosylglycinamide formyltransferase-1